MAMKINTETIRNAATTISQQNDKLLQTLNDSKETVTSLSSTWTGSASTETINAYNSFATKYFSQYHDMLNQYVKFLNGIAAEGYEEIEKAIASKAQDI